MAGAIIRCLPNSSPVVAYNQFYRDAAEITPGLGKVINESFKSVLAPMPLKCLMDIDDAKECLNFSIKTVNTRAQLRKRKGARSPSATRPPRASTASPGGRFPTSAPNSKPGKPLTEASAASRRVSIDATIIDA